MNIQAQASGAIRIGIDVGGTFTDFVLIDGQKQKVSLGKRLTTHADPSRGIIEGLDRLLAEGGYPIDEVDGVVHGTTLITNTVIERNGAKIALVTTRGFRDSLELGKEIRHDRHDLHLRRPEPLVPRHLRLEVTERLRASGDVLLGLVESELLDVAQTLKNEEVEAVAICFLHSYANGVHERLARAILEQELPGVPITLSHEIAPEIREYERANTACANAYVQPMMDRYLTSLDTKLRQRGFSGTLRLMLSGGGLTSVDLAQQRPIHLLESGPAAGAAAATFYSRLLGLSQVISFDMGGTTAKMCLIHHGRPEYSTEFEAARVSRFQKGSGLPMKIPVIDLIEIGAGGGSLARIDGMGLLKVGPQSAGSEPGPVCYGRGGTQPTVTDADLLLGYISPTYFLGGEMPLHLGKVVDALTKDVAEPLGIDASTAAIGIRKIVDDNMAAATRIYIAEKGGDPRDYSMLAFGGAGPVHACALARLLGVRRLIVPIGAGVMSALGFLVAAPTIDLARSYGAPISRIDWRRVSALIREMDAEAAAFLNSPGEHVDPIVRLYSVDMRYSGQGFEIPVAVPALSFERDESSLLEAKFLEAYERRFGRSIPGVTIEVLTWRLKAVGTVPPVSVAPPASEACAAIVQPKEQRLVFFDGRGMTSTPVYDRYSLPSGFQLEGPAIFEERESTTIVEPGYFCEVDPYRNLVVQPCEA
ncbi:hydantoinase/oxoprolinase family protein [Chelatococcus asaccharovorans]|uniref:N-methylhydantoinase A n=1 Tax=Chelatococcus asaccharovorans TaxID=28210 RepID=A0A2V3U9D5_9HYPH|nr:hydantoinase/oxoprolinase family protein [Chelatococcus asaccharovorans]MBS7705589.1 hydantoinase/oxoprolinase family protein [Chelatococcus asaccharovorans]PXW60000.1 N-methylhydantoinase A [Chelatococcus asaccharovorans]